VPPKQASLTDTQNPKILKFERADWTLFRTVEGLQQKAGVTAKLLRRLVLKELGDNALDTGAERHRAKALISTHAASTAR
jgi:hypothetical protein